MKRAALVGALLAATLAGPALAKDALCRTTDDGDYACRFESLDGQGSFRISGTGKPSFELWISAPGEGHVTATFEKEGRAVALPGIYRRSTADGACWVSDATGAELCAW